MNILFLINYAGNGGSEKYVDKLQQVFTADGDNCHLAYNVEGQLSSDFKSRNIPVLKLDLTSGALGKSPKALAQYCRENRIDVIHAQYPVENIIALKSLKYYSSPKVVFTSHLSIDQGFKWKIINRLYTRRNHRIICVCDEGVDILAKNGIDRRKISVIYNGVKPDARRHVFSSDGIFRILVMARFSQEKGLDFLLDILENLRKKTKEPFNCTVLGDGPLFDRISKSAQERGLSDILVLPGFTKETEKYLDCSDLYLNTSRSEAMSFSILEALNAGLPVIATNTGGNGKLTDNIYEFNDADGFCRCILAYMGDKEKLRADSLKAQEKISTCFDLKKLAADVRNAYL